MPPEPRLARSATSEPAPDRSGGLVFPRVPALIARRGDEYVLANAFTGFRGRVQGALCTEVAASLTEGEPTAALRALAEVHPLIAELGRWLETPSLPLDAARAVELDGWDTLFVELTGRCNERCKHCYADAAPEVEHALDRATAEAVIDDAAALGFRRVQFTGGDPLLWPGLDVLVARAAAAGIEEREIYTNGLALTDGLLDRLRPSRPAFALSFYSHDAAAHDAITGVPGSQERTLAAIRRVVAAGLEIRAAIIVMADNAGHLRDTVALLRGLGVEQVSWSSTFAVGRGDRFDDLGDQPDPTPASQRGHQGPRARADGKLAVTYRGEVVPCIFSRDRVLGRLGAARLSDIARRPRRGLAQVGAACDELADRLSCSSCRLTALALDLGPR